MTNSLILASRSPRRARLLAALNVEFRELPVDIDESAIAAGRDAASVVAELARTKARAARQLHTDARVIGADTVVVVGGNVLGKPRSEDEARGFLAELSGAEFEVVTGVAVVDGDETQGEVVVTELSMLSLDPTQVAAYVATGVAADKAGGLELQGRARSFISDVRGCWSNVVGLPLCATARLLRVDYPSGVCEENPL
jgi:septum formation protein